MTEFIFKVFIYDLIIGTFSFNFLFGGFDDGI